jgi:hypothetical protein
MACRRLVDELRERDARRNGTARYRSPPPEQYPEEQRGDAWEPPPEEYPGDHVLDSAGLLTKGSPAEPRQDRKPVHPPLDEVDAAELAHSDESEQLDYLPLLGQEGYFVRGWSHLVAAYPRAGKTELLTACCRDWLAMGETVLYLTEEPRSIWRHRLARAKDAWSGMRLVFGLGAELIELHERLREGPESIAIVDTIRGLGVIRGDENDNGAMAAQLNPWVLAARRTAKTLFFLHHDRKGGGEHGEAIAGGHALLGCVDSALEVRYDAAPSRRVIRTYARLIQPAELMYERHEDGTLHALGSPESVSLEEVRRRVREALDVGEWLKTGEVRERLDDPKPSLPLIRLALTEEAKAGAVEREPPLSAGSAAGKTVRWRAAPNLT